MIHAKGDHVRVVEAIVDRSLQGHAQGLPTRQDRETYSVRVGHEERHQGVSRLVVRDTFPILWREHDVTLAAEHDLL